MVCNRTQKPRNIRPVEASLLPAGRAAWCGQLQLGDCRLPVKAFPATVTSRSSSLCQVHAGCGQKIQQRKFCPQHGELSAGEIGKAYAYAPDDLVALDAAELAQLDAADEKTITLRRFVSETDFDLCLLSGRAFYLVPAHTAAGADYGAVLLAMQAGSVWGVGDMVLSGRRQLVTVWVHHQRIVLSLLHWPAQRRSCPVIDNPPAAPPRRRVKELKATIAANNGTIAWHALNDDWDERLAALVQQKLAKRNGASTGRRRRAAASKRGKQAAATSNGAA